MTYLGGKKMLQEKNGKFFGCGNGNGTNEKK